MSKTVKEHLDETSEITKHLKDGDALILKLQKELTTCRTAIEWMSKFSHPEFRIIPPYGDARPAKDDPCTLKLVADHRINAINALLGDRA